MAKIINFPKLMQPDKPQNEIPIEEATHWVAREINQHCEGMITLGKAYKIHYDEIRDEFYMIDDCGSNSVWFVVLDGEYIQKKFLTHDELAETDYIDCSFKNKY